MNLALFDFDGTITVEDTYTPFIYLSVPKWRLVVCYLILMPIILGFKIGFVGSSTARKAISKFAFMGRDEQTLKSIGEQYALGLDEQINPQALERIKWHQQQGDQIVVVSASLNLYLAPWCQRHGFDLICAELKSNKGRLTGQYREGDCCGVEKSRRILQQYSIEDYDQVFAYGDTEEDQSMLDLADISFYQWQQVKG
ncbi:HAD-IB family hydrolase [Shewanella donghaensis]|uniref:HAD-IB family hydrolase n=1 Tax=Shewanella donghaensis TaxID=238836 RepID=UPI0011831916|nr:HAD-IB family hydrolase [Shewanella donghaensis]